MRRRESALFLALVIAASCGPSQPDLHRSGRGTGAISNGPESLPPGAPIEWPRSGAVFIGVQTFHERSGLEVPWAADDAVDLAWLFTHQLRLLSPDQVTLLLAGGPEKPTSRTHLAALRSEATVIEDRHGGAQRSCLDAPTIMTTVRAQARRVGPRGVLIVAFASHGVSQHGKHYLLTADAALNEFRGVVLADVLDSIAAEGTKRLILLIDACRSQPRQGYSSPKPESFPARLPKTFLEDVNLRTAYAVLSSTGPGGYAQAGEGNGYFTRAVIEGLQGNASCLPNGEITLGNLAGWVSERVPQLTHDGQQPESRMGGIGGVRLVRCAPPTRPCEILKPAAGAAVKPVDVVRFRILRPEIFATVLICSPVNNVCYNQNPRDEPIPTHTGEVVDLAVHYGNPGTYKVRVVSSADPAFLRGRHQGSFLDRSTDANRPVQSCGPAEVTLEKEIEK